MSLIPDLGDLLSVLDWEVHPHPVFAALIDSKVLLRDMGVQVPDPLTPADGIADSFRHVAFEQ